MKNLITIALIVITTTLMAQTSRRITNAGNTASLVNAGPTDINFINACNTSTDTVKLLIYNTNTIPTYTSTATDHFEMFPNQDICPSIFTTLKYKSGCYIRVAKGGTIGAADSYTVQPRHSPDISFKW